MQLTVETHRILILRSYYCSWPVAQWRFAQNLRLDLTINSVHFVYSDIICQIAWVGYHIC